MKKRLVWLLCLTTVMSGVIACSDGNHQAACASPVVYFKPSPPSPKPSPPKTPSGGTKTPSGGGTKTTPKPTPPKTGSGSTKPSASTPKPKVTTSGTGASRKTTVTPPGEKSYTPPSPKVKPSTQDYSKAQTSAPRSITTAGGYTSPVTNHYYVYHGPDYFTTAIMLSAIDLYNPYDPYNYYGRPFSPFFGRPYLVGQDCGGSSEEFKLQQQELDLVNAKVDLIEKRLDAGQQPDQLSDLDNDGAVAVPATTATTTASG